MCVIYVCTTKLPPADELARGATRNDDGAGIAWLSNLKGGKLGVQWQKGLKDDREVVKFIEKHKINFPYIIHFRTASAGPRTTELTHPFPISAEAETWEAGTADEVLFHNGHITGWEDLLLSVGLRSDQSFPEDGQWSDSRALAWITYLKGPGVLPFILKGSRVAILSANNHLTAEKNYSRAVDHIETYGFWYNKDGYSQSIETGGGTTGVVHGRGYKRERADDVEPLAAVPRLLGPASEHQWPIETLEQLVSDIEKGQISANQAIGS